MARLNRNNNRIAASASAAESSLSLYSTPTKFQLLVGLGLGTAMVVLLYTNSQIALTTIEAHTEASSTELKRLHDELEEVEANIPMGDDFIPNKISWALHHQGKETSADEEKYYHSLRKPTSTELDLPYLILSKEEADFAHKKCILEHEFGYQMMPTFCWNPHLLNGKPPESVPLDPMPIFQGKWFHFTGDSLARHAFHGFRCIITKGCRIPADDSWKFEQPTSKKIVKFWHGFIKMEPINNITISYSWAPLLKNIPADLKKRFSQQGGQLVAAHTQPDAVFILAGHHQANIKITEARNVSSTFANELSKLMSQKIIHNVTFQTAPSTMTANNIYINTVVMDRLTKLYPQGLTILDGYFPEPVNDQRDGVHSLHHGHAAGARYAWSYLWNIYGQQNNLSAV
jgi:hypothetical protein